ncbi:hypothetical protein WJX79_006725 [Trebouxia sp. C0005]
MCIRKSPSTDQRPQEVLFKIWLSACGCGQTLLYITPAQRPRTQSCTSEAVVGNALYRFCLLRVYLLNQPLCTVRLLRKAKVMAAMCLRAARHPRHHHSLSSKIQGTWLPPWGCNY